MNPTKMPSGVEQYQYSSDPTDLSNVNPTKMPSGVEQLLEAGIGDRRGW